MCSQQSSSATAATLGHGQKGCDDKKDATPQKPDRPPLPKAALIDNTPPKRKLSNPSPLWEVIKRVKNAQKYEGYDDTVTHVCTIVMGTDEETNHPVVCRKGLRLSKANAKTGSNRPGPWITSQGWDHIKKEHPDHPLLAAGCGMLPRQKLVPRGNTTCW